MSGGLTSVVLAVAVGACFAVRAAEPEIDWAARIEAMRAAHPDSLFAPLVSAWSGDGFIDASPVDNLRVPLDHFENGRVRIYLSARKGAFRTDGLLRGESVKLVFLTDEGKPDGELTADGAVFDRQKRTGYAVGQVRMTRQGDQIEGERAVFALADKYVKLLSQVKVTTARIKVDLGR